MKLKEKMKKPVMKLSIIIPVYNQEKLIIKALDSIPMREDVEIIVIDDGSVDDTFNNVEKYKEENVSKNITLLSNEENKGVSYTINKGLDNVKGEYIVFLGSDDYFYIEELEKVINELDGTDLVYFNLRTNDGTIFDVNQNTKMGYCGSVKFMRKELIGATRNKEDLRHSKDYFFYQELLSKNPTEKFTGIIAKHYNYPREGSLSSIQRQESGR